jgi:hypothetical protein
LLFYNQITTISGGNVKKRKEILSSDDPFWRRARDLRCRISVFLAKLVFMGFSNDILAFKIEVSYSGKKAKLFFHEEILKRIIKILKFHSEIKKNRKIISPKGFRMKKRYVEIVGESGLSHLSLVIKSIFRDMCCEVLTSQEIEEVKKINKNIIEVFSFSSRYNIFVKTDKECGFIVRIIFESREEGGFPMFLEVGGKNAEEVKQKIISLKRHCQEKKYYRYRFKRSIFY